MHADTRNRINDKISLLALIASIGALMLATRPYYGIWHDAILYTGQAIKLLHPQSYVNDLFFMNGSQDNYTIFTNFYALFVDWLGINAAAMWLVIAGQLIWVVAAFSLMKKLLAPPQHWIALAAALVCLVYYSDNSIFMVREGFVTSRLFAEGLTLFSLAALYDKKYYITGLLLLGALLIHPLVALTALLFIYCLLLIRYPRTVLLIGAGGASAVILLGLLGIAPANGLFIPVDQQWFAITSARSSHLYMTTWAPSFWNSILITLAFLAYAVARVGKEQGLFIKAILLSTVLALAVSGFASITLSSVLLVQLQLWRILWLTQFIALSAAVFIIWQAWQKKEDYLPLLGFVAALLFIDSIGGLIAIAVCAYALSGKIISINRRLASGIIFGLFILGLVEQMALGWIYISNTFAIQFDDIANIDTKNKLDNYIVKSVVVFMALGSIAITLARKESMLRRGIPPVVAIGLMLFVTTQWDMRNNIPPTFAESGNQETVLRDTIKPEETVYWSDSPYLTWFMLRRSSYYSIAQTAGLIFNRDTALEAIGRHINTNHLYHMSSGGNSLAKHGPRKLASELTYADITATCSDPGLDWLVLENNLPEKRMKYSVHEGHYWYFYKCKDFRKSSQREKG